MRLCLCAAADARSVKKGMYTTVEDYQTSIDINIYEGERSHVEGNTQIGEFVISGIERAKRDTAKVEVRPPKLTVAFSHSPYVVLTYRVVGTRCALRLIPTAS